MASEVQWLNDEKIKKYLQDALDKHQRGEHEQAI